MKLQLATVLCSTLLSSYLSQNCSNPVVRKEIRELTKDEFKRYATAVNTLHSRKTWGYQFSNYEYFSDIHLKNKDYAHGKPAFLPWHRYFLRLYEKALQQIDPSVNLPYWDWSLDSQNPHESIVLTDKYIGGDGNKAAKTYCLDTGAFKNWNMSYPTNNKHCLKRDYDGGDFLYPFSSPEEIVLDINEKKFSDFSYKFELKHGDPHTSIGGYEGDFYPMYSPNDPIFYLHHAFVDMIWSEWQLRNPNSVYEGTRYRKNATVNDTLKPWTAKVNSTLNILHPEYCYTYKRYPRLLEIPNEDEEPISSSVQSSSSTSTNSASATSTSSETAISTTSSSNISFTGSTTSAATAISSSASSTISSSSSITSAATTTTTSNTTTASAANKLVRRKYKLNLSPHQKLPKFLADAVTNNPILHNLDLTTRTLIEKLAENKIQFNSQLGRTMRFNLKKKKPKTNKWIEMNHFDIKEVRKLESESNTLIDLLNNQQNFVSLANVNELINYDN